MTSETRTTPSSSTPGVVYTTTRSGDSFTCTCPGYLKRAVRTCTHIKTWQSAAPVAAPAAVVVAPKLVAVAPAATSVEHVKPMLAIAMPEGKSVEDFATDGWVLEPKIDGHRVVVARTSSGVEAWARPRNGAPQAKTLAAHVASALLTLPEGIYDGELYVPGGTSSDVTKLDKRDSLRVVLFDILAVGSVSVMSAPEAARRALLELAGAHYDVASNGGSVLSVIPQLPVSADTVQTIWDNGGEGAMLKSVTGIYRPGARSADWVKVKRLSAIVGVVTGYEAGSFGPHSKVLVRCDDGVETSVKTKNAATLRQFDANADAFIGRRLVLAYTERTPDGNLRHPRFDHFEGAGD